MNQVVSDVKVTLLSAAGEVDLTSSVLNLSMTDGMGSTAPSATVTLPLKRTVSTSSRVPMREVVRLGDLITIDAIAWDGIAAKWECIFDGRVSGVQENESLNDKDYEVTFQVSCEANTGLLELDAVSWWMYVATIEGWNQTTAAFAVDAQSGKPYEAAHRYLTRMAFNYSNWDHLGYKLEDAMHTSFSGLPMVAAYEQNWTMYEGSHMGAISQVLDSPIHEMYATTLPAARVNGQVITRAIKPRGEANAASTLIMRAAPYPFGDESLKGNVSEWQALPVHNVEVTNDEGVGFVDTAVKNFFIVSAGSWYSRDDLQLAAGTVVKNSASIKKYARRPLKTSTRLIFNADGSKPGDIALFTRKLVNRLAGQWNRQDEMLAGQVQTIFAPHIRPGERVRLPSPLSTDDTYEFHVKSRALRWNPQSGGGTTLTLERGLPVGVYKDAAWFTAGLEKIEVPHPNKGVSATAKDRGTGR